MTSCRKRCFSFFYRGTWNLNAHLTPFLLLLRSGQLRNKPIRFLTDWSKILSSKCWFEIKKQFSRLQFDEPVRATSGFLHFRRKEDFASSSWRGNERSDFTARIASVAGYLSYSHSVFIFTSMSATLSTSMSVALYTYMSATFSTSMFATMSTSMSPTMSTSMFLPLWIFWHPLLLGKF